jgi:hypothetical protein
MPAMRTSNRIAAITMVSTLAAATASVPATAATPTTLRFQTENNVVTAIDIGPAGKSPGDIYVYAGDVMLGGKKVGGVYGSHTSIKVEGQFETVSGQATFELGGGDSLVVAGLTQYPADANNGAVLNKGFTRVVVGGTGRYAGARGTIVSTRVGSNVYRQVVRFKR